MNTQLPNSKYKAGKDKKSRIAAVICLILCIVMVGGVIAAAVISVKAETAEPVTGTEPAEDTAEVMEDSDTADTGTQPPETEEPTGTDTAPATTEPETTEPETDDPVTTEPETTEPETTEPETTEPETEPPDPPEPRKKRSVRAPASMQRKKPLRWRYV